MNEPITLVILVHNEADVIERVIRDFMDKVINKIPDSEFIVAEDGSTDGTKEILARLVEEYPSLKWVEGKERLGYVRAYKRAMSLAKNKLILFCDSGGKHDPNDFWKMYPLMNKYDMVIGYKVKRRDPFYRIIITKMFNFLINTYFGVSFRDIDCPLRLIKKSAYDNIAKDEWLEKFLVNYELVIRMVYAGYRVTEVPVIHFNRESGSSRGLPLNKIPRVILSTISIMPKIKKKI
ncbi:glycosyltransferase family 2 protein [Pelotomaculum terephthalicicum JT]|uniref:glycosyltransferase family 2 protein n=1 Tax=Pelotomaculum terephthalicicum TaxID=206393 RepID=UPI001F03773F|nr:glycosyltransferase family 2 protein [Pelotomaculum terephthalicicum]MCG9966634.1 glycosyltransferase family 2 protein [Pelotomaculum terephthalicicum JT]